MRWRTNLFCHEWEGADDGGLRGARFLPTFPAMDRPDDKRPDDDDDENDPLVRHAKLAGRVLGYLFVGYLVFALGRQLKFW